MRLVRLRERADVAWLLLGTVAAGVIALPVLTLDIGAVRWRPARGRARDNADLGNLAQPLKTAQALGIWLNGDYRYRPTNLASQQDYLLILFAAAAIAGLAWAIRRRAWGPLLLGATLVPTSLYLTRAAAHTPMRRCSSSCRSSRRCSRCWARRASGARACTCSAGSSPRHCSAASPGPAPSPTTTSRSRRTRATRNCWTSTRAWPGTARRCFSSTTSSRSTSCATPPSTASPSSRRRTARSPITPTRCRTPTAGRARSPPRTSTTSRSATWSPCRTSSCGARRRRAARRRTSGSSRAARSTRCGRAARGRGCSHTGPWGPTCSPRARA